MSFTIPRQPLPEPADPGDPTGSPAPRSTLGGWARLGIIVALVIGLGYLAGLGLVAMILAIVVSIFLHELGHFVVAKRSGMKVTEYFIGFGPRLWSFRRGETEYGLKAIPAGAYVRIVGMSNLEETDPADEPRTYRAQSYPKRLATVLAGPFANFAIALVLLLVVFAGFGVPRTDRWSVAGVLDGSAAAVAGVQPGDRIVSINGQDVRQFGDVGSAMATTAGRPTEIVVERDGQPVTLTATAGWRLNAAGAAALDPFQDGDRIVSVNGQAVTSYDQFAAALASGQGQATIEFERGAYGYTTDVNVPVQMPADGADGFLGVVRSSYPLERLAPAAAVTRTVTEFGSVVGQSVTGVGRILSPTGLSRYAELVTTSGQGSDAKDSSPAIRPLSNDAPQVLSGNQAALQESRPLSIVGVMRLGSQAADSGAVSFLWTLILVNVFLGLFNLLPLPPLDGGHALVATYEAVRGRLSGRRYRVDMAKLMPVTYTVLFLLVGLGLTSMYLDIVSPAPNPFGP